MKSGLFSFLLALSAMTAIFSTMCLHASDIESTQQFQKIVQLDNTNFAQIIESQMPVVVKVYAPWCGPCKQMEPDFERVFEHLKGQCIFATINTDQSYGLSVQLRIRAIPTLLFFKEGKEIGRYVGYSSYEQILDYIHRHLGITSNSNQPTPNNR